MLGLRKAPVLANNVSAPLFSSKFNRGFITEFERPVVRDLLDTATREGSDAKSCWSN
jgi:hypothetical protein